MLASFAFRTVTGLTRRLATATLAVTLLLSISHGPSQAEPSETNDRASAEETAPARELTMNNTQRTEGTAPTGRLIADVGTFQHTRGLLGCSLFASEAGYPEDISQALILRVAVKARAVPCTYENLPPGTYALSVIHDENGSKALEKSFLGMPKEPWGTSRNVTHTFRAPSFDEIRIVVKAGQTVRIKIDLPPP